MITWTDSAHATLDSHNQAVREQLLSAGADPDEVASDLRRHIEEELIAARISIVSSDDVLRVLGKMGVEAPLVPRPHTRGKSSLNRIVLIVIVLAALVATVVLYRRTFGNEAKHLATTAQVVSVSVPASVPATSPRSEGNLSSDWAGYAPSQKAFYGIGCVAAFLIVILGCFQLIGMEIHADIDHPDHNGASLFSVKPIIGFFFGLGWAGGVLCGEMSLAPAMALALLAGTCSMFLIWGIVRVFVAGQNDGSMSLQSAIGKEGIVYTTIDPVQGGLIQVALNTGLETLAAVTRESKPISTGKTVTVIQLDGPNLLVESKKT